MFYFLDTSVGNTYVLYTLAEGSKMNMEEFRLSITEYLVADKMFFSGQSIDSNLPIIIKKRKPYQTEAIRLT